MPTEELPLCKWRGNETRIKHYVCNSPKIMVSRDGVPESLCRSCSLVNHASDSMSKSLPCVHLGEPTGQLVACPTCPNSNISTHEVPILACGIHGSTTGKRGAIGHRSCHNCPDKSPVIPNGWLLIPQPPTLDLSPKSRRAIVTVVVGEDAERCLDSSGSAIRSYADRLGADFVVLDWPGHPYWPISSKFAIARVLDHYDRIAYVDADVLLRPGCMDLFDSCQPSEIGVVDELLHHRQQPNHQREASYRRFREDMGFRAVADIPWIFNAGVIVVPKSHKELLLPPVGPMPVGHCAEQDHTNARLLDSELPYRLMDRRCNWQSWTDSGFKAAPKEAILHWSGTGANRILRAQQILEWSNRS